MSITEYNKNINITDYQEVKIGKLYFLKNYVIGEFNEGINIDVANFKESSEMISNYFGNENFGFIANRTNSYSLNLGDAKVFNQMFPNLKAYAVVSDSLFAKGVFEVENQFFTYNRRIFQILEDAINWVEESLGNSI